MNYRKAIHTLLSTRALRKLVPPSELGLAGRLAGRLGNGSNRNRFEVVGVETVIGVAGPGSLILLFRLSLSPARDLPPTPPS